MMTMRYLALAVAVVAATLGVTPSVQAQEVFGAHLSGVQEVPPIYSQGHGFALVGIDYDAETVGYSVVYFNLGSNATQAHIHFGTPGVNGAIVAFLCSNLPGKPAGVQACPNAPGLNTISGTLTTADVQAVGAQGIGIGDFDALAAIIDSSAAYVNVHTATFPGGEVRGPLGH